MKRLVFIGLLVGFGVSARAERCANIEGRWQRPQGNNIIEIFQDRCEFSGIMTNRGFTHFVRGSVHDLEFANGVMLRVNRGNRCETRLVTTIKVINGRFIEMTLDRSDGRCELPASFTETFTYNQIH